MTAASPQAATSPQAHTGVSGRSNPAEANSPGSRKFSGAHINPIHGTPNPLLQKAAPKTNVRATANPLLQKAAPGASANPQGRQAVREFASAGTNARPAGNGAGWGWAGLFGVIGLAGLIRRFGG